MTKRTTMIKPARWWGFFAALIALVHAGIAWRALRVPPDLAAVVRLPMPLDFVAGVLFTCVFTVVALRLWQGRKNSIYLVSWAVISCGAYNALRLMLFTHADYDRQRLPILLLGLLVLLIVSIIRFRTQKYGEKIHDNESQD